LTPLLV